MAAPLDKPVNFQYCEICKINHTDNYRHLYTKKHKLLINKICQKMRDKVNRNDRTVIV